jgi:hypothetical protein
VAVSALPWALLLAVSQSSGASATADAGAVPTTDVEVRFAYRVSLKPSERVANVRLVVRQREPGLARLKFHVDPAQHLGFEGDGDIAVEGSDYVVWTVPPRGGSIQWTSRLDHLRDPTSYDARFGTNWALFRGSDLVPPAASRYVSGSRSSGTLKLDLPKKWKFVSRHPIAEDGLYVLEDPDRFFARPSGWMMVGRIETQTFEVEGMQVTLATTRKLGVDLMELRSFLRWTLPTFKAILGDLPPRLVLVGAGDPMWRGGLSGPQSIYLHRDRPLVDDDGTSPILHELTHVFMGAKAGPGGDWVVEGLAEYYAIEVLHRSGGMSAGERIDAHRRLRRKGRKVDELEVDRAKSRVTARSVAVLDRLDQRMRDLTDDRANLDLVLRRLVTLDEPITTELFKALVEEVVGQKMDAFFETYVAEAQSP